MMKDRTRKTLRAALMAGLMAMGLLLSPILSANAEPLPPDTGSLTIVKYLGDTTRPINNVVFDLYKVTIRPGDANGVPPTGPNVTYKLSTDSSKVEVYDSGAKVAEFGVAAASTPRLTTGAGGAAAGTATASNLPQGVYLVIENHSLSTGAELADGTPVSISSAYRPFLVAVPMTNPDGNGWIADVIVEPKNEAVGVTKSVSVPSGNAVAIGDVITYTIESTVPNDIATSRKYNIIDRLDTALTLEDGSVKVYALDGNGLLTPGTHYTLDLPTSTNSNTLTVRITPAATPPTGGSGMEFLDGYAKVKVVFDVKVNANILDRIDLEVDNEATLEFTNSGGDEVEAGTGGGGPTIHTAAIEVTKLDQSRAALNGAKFRIATSLANVRNGDFLKITTEKVILDAGSTGYGAVTTYYELDLTSTNVGRFTGLKDVVGGAPQTYYLVEVQAPSNYNLLNEPVKVDFTGLEANHSASVEIVNSREFTLPTTGGAGTFGFAVAGLVLVGLSLALALGKMGGKSKRADR